MTALSDSAAEDRAVRRRILRRASYYTFGFFIMAVVVASVGSALIAWFLTITGLPFRMTWLVLTISVLTIASIIMAVDAVRKRLPGRRGRMDGSGQGILSDGG